MTGTQRLRKPAWWRILGETTGKTGRAAGGGELTFGTRRSRKSSALFARKTSLRSTRPVSQESVPVILSPPQRGKMTGTQRLRKPAWWRILGETTGKTGRAAGGGELTFGTQRSRKSSAHFARKTSLRSTRPVSQESSAGYFISLTARQNDRHAATSETGLVAHSWRDDGQNGSSRRRRRVDFRDTEVP